MLAEGGVSGGGNRATAGSAGLPRSCELQKGRRSRRDERGSHGNRDGSPNTASAPAEKS